MMFKMLVQLKMKYNNGSVMMMTTKTKWMKHQELVDHEYLIVGLDVSI